MEHGDYCHTHTYTQGRTPQSQQSMERTQCQSLSIPVRILLVSEGHRSRARMPGMLALCSPCSKAKANINTLSQLEGRTLLLNLISCQATQGEVLTKDKYHQALQEGSSVLKGILSCLCPRAQVLRGDFADRGHHTHHMRSHLPVLAEFFWLHQLLWHSLPSLPKQPQRSHPPETGASHHPSTGSCTFSVLT